MFVAQVLDDDSSCQRAVNDCIVRCLQHGQRPPGTSTAAYCEARARVPISLVETLFKTVDRQVRENALPGPRQVRVRQVVSRHRGFQDTFYITSLTDQRVVGAR